jgi:outer membrane beta-barrel protein
MFVALLGVGQIAKAETEVIEFPREELANESVVPVFDETQSVKARNVTTSHRLELGLFGGYALTEPFFNPYSVGLSGTYHLTEEHGINLTAFFMQSGTSSYADALNPVPGTTANANLQYAPAPKYLFMGSYQFTGFYGKLSLTKSTVMNLNLYGLAGVGLYEIGDSSCPAVSVGLGQKFYFNNQFALRLDLRLIAYNGPDVLSKNLQNATGTASSSEFSNKLQFSTLLTLGGVYLLPEF